LAAESMKREQPVGRCPTIEQEGLRYEFRTRAAKFVENLQLRFADNSTGFYPGICRGRHVESAVANRQPQIINAHGNVKEPRRPKFPARPAPNECRYQRKLSDQQEGCADKKRGENNRGDFALKEGEPNQSVTAE